MRKSLTVTGAVLSALHGVAHGSDNADRNKGLTDLAVHDAGFAVTLTAPLNVNVRNMYASHSSHSSHASHSSGSSGIYARPRITPPHIHQPIRHHHRHQRQLLPIATRPEYSL